MSTCNNIQGKCWTFLVYPESAPPDWRDIFENLHISGAYSVVHSDDDGLSKDHVHCILEFPQNMTINRVKQIVKDNFENGATQPFIVYDKPRMYRYLSHLDDKSKKQYDPNLVTYYNVPYWEYIQTVGGVNDVLNEICQFCRENPDICSFRSLYDYAAHIKNLNWLSCIQSHVYFFSSYFRS